MTVRSQVAPAADVGPFVERVRAFLRDNLPPDWKGIGYLQPAEVTPFLEQWRGRLRDAGLLGLAWPTAYGGGGLDVAAHLVLVEECARARVPVGTPADAFSIKLLGNTLVRWGSEEQKRTLLPRIISGEDVWCQGYSEPGAGSDLASVRTTARLVDDQWEISGQKIWTSNAAHASAIFLLARTNPDVAKHRGLSFLLCPLDQPGVEVRPIEMAGGGSDFCEVFFDRARTPVANVVGGIDNGWKVATGLLSIERGEEAAVNPVYFAYELERLVDLAREHGELADPDVRRRLTDCHVSVQVMKALGRRIVGGYLATGRIGPEASISKLFWSEYHQVATELAVDILGLAGLAYEGEPPYKWFRTDEAGARNSPTAWMTLYLQNAMSGTVYAGTSEIQRNIIAESALGMPREPS